MALFSFEARCVCSRAMIMKYKTLEAVPRDKPEAPKQAERRFGRSCRVIVSQSQKNTNYMCVFYIHKAEVFRWSVAFSD